MVGGKVIEVIGNGDWLWVNCRDRQYPADTCAVRVEQKAQYVPIQPGDSLWWQWDCAFWTPKANVADEEHIKARGLQCRIDYEIALRKIGASGLNRPELEVGMIHLLPAVEG